MPGSHLTEPQGKLKLDVFFIVFMTDKDISKNAACNNGRRRINGEGAYVWKSPHRTARKIKINGVSSFSVFR